MRQFQGQWRFIRFVLALMLAVAFVTPLRAADPPAGSMDASAGTVTPTTMPATPVPGVGIPTRLRIPAIKVDSGVEQVGKTPEGAMALPQAPMDTGWYNLGPRPGEPGNAVIAGHVDWISSLAVFWNLRKLNPGDEIFVTGDDGVERRFVVAGLESYRYEDAPLARIFGPASGVHLNLITCDNQSHFDRTSAEYAGAVVVYADAA